MPRRRNLTRLSAGEMDLLRMLWERGPLTLAQRIKYLMAMGWRLPTLRCKRG